MNTIPILIIDDDEELCALLSKALSREGFEVSSSHDAESGLKRALEGNHRLIILDVMLPGGNGIELLRKLRRSSAIPVIMLTARGDDRDRIDGLELGADDYVPKPFNTRELAARIRAVLRRIPKTPAPEILSVGDVEVNLVRHEVLQLGKPVDLTGSEYDILVLLLQSAGEAVSRETLSRKALGHPVAFLDRSIDMHISNLRKKLGARIGTAERIRSIRGTGYIYTAQ